MLAGAPAAFVRADVSLGGEPVIGSFTVDGLTFAVTEGSSVELVGVSPDRQRVAGSQDADGSPVAPMPASGADGLEAGGPAAAEAEPGGPTLALPESVSYEGIDYAVASIGAYAFYLSGVASVELPASVEQVDERAFRSSDVAAVEVADGNQSCSSFDGALYSADYSRLLLIPEGKQGAVRMPSAVVAALPSAFSHCAGVDAIMADAGGAAFASENGLLYDASLTTLIRVPAGAADITIRDGCTAIAAGAMEGCAQLTSVTAPASVTSVSPDVFASVPTVSLPAVSAAADDPGASTGATEGSSGQAGSTPASSSTSAQLTAMVALSTTDDDLPEVDPSLIKVAVAPEANRVWNERGFAALSGATGPIMAESELAEASVEAGSTYSADVYDVTFHGNGGSMVGSVSWTKALELGSTAWYQVPAASRKDYTFKGFYTAPNGGTLVYEAANGIAVNVNDGVYWKDGRWNYEGDVTFYAQWVEGNTYELILDGNGGTIGGQPLWAPSSSKVQFGQGSWYRVPAAAREGYAFMGFYTARSGGVQIYEPEATAAAANCTNDGTYWKDTKWNYPGNATFYAQWKANSYTIAFDAQGGSTASSVQATYDADAVLPTSERQGYVFQGWDTEADGTGVRYQAGTHTKPNLTATADDTVTLYAQWEPVLSADVPLEVTARVDLLGIEEQEEATGYIESRCGEPLTVADVAFEPLAGATELFGASSVADVALEVLAAGSTSPDARFALDASATQAPASAAAFRMAAYGTRVPISYRFAIPDELLPSLAEATKPVCAVAYTVALA